MYDWIVGLACFDGLLNGPPTNGSIFLFCLVHHHQQASITAIDRKMQQQQQKALGAYREVLRLVRRLPKDTRAYYAKYARENFVNYREVEPDVSGAVPELLRRTYTHTLWVLNKYSVDEAAANKLKTICSST